MTHALLQRDLSDLIGLNTLPEEERETMLANIGSLILESVMLRAIAGMPDADAKKLGECIATDPAPEVLLEVLQNLVPDLEDLMEEETLAFKQECVDVMERQSTKEVV